MSSGILESGASGNERRGVIIAHFERFPQRAGISAQFSHQPGKIVGLVNIFCQRQTEIVVQSCQQGNRVGAVQFADRQARRIQQGIRLVSGQDNPRTAQPAQYFLAPLRVVKQRLGAIKYD